MIIENDCIFLQSLALDGETQRRGSDGREGGDGGDQRPAGRTRIALN
jgi:hypothetical protein